IEAMEEIGLSIGGHRARLLTPDLASSYDLILTMDRDHTRTVRALGARVEVAALGDYAGIPGDVEAPCDSREECAACRDHLRRPTWGAGTTRPRSSGVRRGAAELLVLNRRPTSSTCWPRLTVRGSPCSYTCRTARRPVREPTNPEETSPISTIIGPDPPDHVA